MNKIRFGSSGNSSAFYEAGNSHTYQEPAWLAQLGLDAYEYPYGRGGKLSEETASQIQSEANQYGIAMSIHAPYYINLTNEDNQKNIEYFAETSKLAKYMGATRVIFHPGSVGSKNHDEALQMAKKNLKDCLSNMESIGFTQILYCPETMGKPGLIGTLDDIMEFCAVDDRIYPSIDFGHLNALTNGGIKSKADYENILDTVKQKVGEQKYRNMHIHFTHIEYTAKGEKKHLTFADKTYGPFFKPLAELLYERQLTPVIICESDGTQDKDAVTMKKMFEACK